MSEPNVAVIASRIGYGTRLTYRVVYLVKTPDDHVPIVGVPAEREHVGPNSTWFKQYSRRADAFAAARAIPNAIVDTRLWCTARRVVDAVIPISQ
jgi:hypothetical protein